MGPIAEQHYRRYPKVPRDTRRLKVETTNRYSFPIALNVRYVYVSAVYGYLCFVFCFHSIHSEIEPCKLGLYMCKNTLLVHNNCSQTPNKLTNYPNYNICDKMSPEEIAEVTSRYFLPRNVWRHLEDSKILLRLFSWSLRFAGEKVYKLALNPISKCNLVFHIISQLYILR